MAELASQEDALLGKRLRPGVLVLGERNVGKVDQRRLDAEAVASLRRDRASVLVHGLRTRMVARVLRETAEVPEYVRLNRLVTARPCEGGSLLEPLARAGELAQ